MPKDDKEPREPEVIQKTPLIVAAIVGVVVVGFVYLGLHHNRTAEAAMAEQTTALGKARAQQQTAKVDAAYHEAMETYHRTQAAEADSISDTIYHNSRAVSHSALAAAARGSEGYNGAVAAYRTDKIEQVVSRSVLP